MQQRSEADRVRELETLLEGAQRAATTGLLAAGVSHDVANHLLVVVGNAALLLADYDDARLHDIVRSAERAAELNRSVLRAGHRRHHEPAGAMHVGETLRELEPLLTTLAGGGIRLELDAPASLPSVAVDRYALESTLVNLVANARDALGCEGLIRISARETARGILVEVEDDGPGIPTEALPHLFEPFFGLNPKGSGVGLAVSRALLEAQGGSIAAANRACGGATFLLLLPLAPG